MQQEESWKKHEKLVGQGIDHSFGKRGIEAGARNGKLASFLVLGIPKKSRNVVQIRSQQKHQPNAPISHGKHDETDQNKERLRMGSDEAWPLSLKKEHKARKKHFDHKHEQQNGANN